MLNPFGPPSNGSLHELVMFNCIMTLKLVYVFITSFILVLCWTMYYTTVYYIIY